MVNHSALESIKAVRPITNPIWKMAITLSEYNSLKACLRQAYYERNLMFYPIEAAICYAEWWKTEYNGRKASESEIAKAMGLPGSAGADLYNAAKSALALWRIPIIKHRNQLRFRTLLLQGGLPMRHVMNNLGRYTSFLKGLVSELSRISVDWEDTGIVPKLDCISNLPVSFRNEDIYALGLQIARAIIEERDDLLPYDSNNVSLLKLTIALRQERERTKRLALHKPLSFKWELGISNDEGGKRGYLRYSLESVRNLYSSSLEGFHADNCYQFDLYVSKRYVATYKRVSSEDGEEVYRRMNTSNISFDWKGEPVIEVKIICDTGESFFITVIGCYPPDFSNPQLFQLNDRVYVQQRNLSSSDNIVIYSDDWYELESESETLNIGEDSFNLVHFATSVTLVSRQTGMPREIKGKYTSYAVEYKDIFMDWLEESNYALINRSPFIVAFDENDIRVKQDIHPSYRRKVDANWTKLQRTTVLPPGLVEIKVTMPDGVDIVKTFYSIGNLSFSSSSEEAFSGIIECRCDWGDVYPKVQKGLQYEPLGRNKWKVTRQQDNQFPATCTFDILVAGSRNLEISVASPFKGICLVDRNGDVIKNGSTLSMSNLLNYTIVSKGTRKQSLFFSFTDRKEKSDYVTLTSDMDSGILPLSNFEETINRLYDLYGNNHFDRSNAVSLQINKNVYFVRHFTLDSRMTESRSIRLVKLNEEPYQSRYEGKLLACPAVDPGVESSLGTVELNQIGDAEFVFPNECVGGYIVFSDKYDKRRIVPKLYMIGMDVEDNAKVSENSTGTTRPISLGSFSELRMLSTELGFRVKDAEADGRARQQQDNIKLWTRTLSSEDVTYSSNWEKVGEYLDVASRYRLPFTTFNAITAAVSKPSLFAKLLLRMFLDGKNDQMISEINRLEREYALAVHWLRPSDFGAVIEEIMKNAAMAQFLVPTFAEFVKELLSATLEPESAIAFFPHMIGNQGFDKGRRLDHSEVFSLRAQAVGRDDTNRDLPVDDLPLIGKYYGGKVAQGMTDCQATLIHSPLFVFEYVAGMNNDLWRSDRLVRRRIINYYRRYFMRSYCQILSKLMN